MGPQVDPDQDQLIYLFIFYCADGCVCGWERQSDSSRHTYTPDTNLLLPACSPGVNLLISMLSTKTWIFSPRIARSFLLLVWYLYHTLFEHCLHYLFPCVLLCELLLPACSDSQDYTIIQHLHNKSVRMSYLFLSFLVQILLKSLYQSQYTHTKLRFLYPTGNQTLHCLSKKSRNLFVINSRNIPFTFPQIIHLEYACTWLAHAVPAVPGMLMLGSAFFVYWTILH